MKIPQLAVDQTTVPVTRVNERAYRDGLLIVGYDAAESLHVSFLLSEGQLQSSHLTLEFLQTAELVINGVLQEAEGQAITFLQYVAFQFHPFE